MVICLELGADLHMAQLMPLPLTVSCFSKIQIGFAFLVPAHPVSPRKRAVKQVCVWLLKWHLRNVSILRIRLHYSPACSSIRVFHGGLWESSCWPVECECVWLSMFLQVIVNVITFLASHLIFTSCKLQLLSLCVHCDYWMTGVGPWCVQDSSWIPVHNNYLQHQHHSRPLCSLPLLHRHQRIA